MLLFRGEQTLLCCTHFRREYQRILGAGIAADPQKCGVGESSLPELA
jgi:hypothetical protein